MEDQPADSGDLTTGPADAAPTDGTQVTVARRKHRMPLSKKMAAGSADDVATPPDESSSVATQIAAEPVDPAPARRRRFGLRRRPKPAQAVPAEAEPESEVTAEEVKPTPRKPVGKAARAASVQQSADEPDAAPDTEPEAEPEAEPVTAHEVRFKPHQPAGRRLTAAAAAAAVLFVGAAGFAGAMAQPYLEDRAEVVIKLDVARTAANAISTLWTYTPDDMESLADRSAKFLGGDFAFEYRRYVDAIVAPNKQAQVTNTTDVLGAAVESLTPSEATAIVYTNSVATSPVTKNIPSLRYLSYRLTMERRDADWLITRMSTVTSLDLTPQL